MSSSSSDFPSDSSASSEAPSSSDSSSSSEPPSSSDSSSSDSSSSSNPLPPSSKWDTYGTRFPYTSGFSPGHSVLDGAMSACSNLEKLADSILFNQVILRAQNAVSVSAGALTINGAALTADGINSLDVGVLQRWIQTANDLKTSGLIALTAPAPYFTVSTSSGVYPSGIVIEKTINGERYAMEVQSTWWGTRVWLTKPLAAKLSSLIGMGAGAAAIAAALAAEGIITSPGAVPLGILSGGLWILGELISFMDFCNGVYLNFPFVGAPVLTPA